MKITNNKVKTVKFGDLCNGDTFIFNNDVYLVLPVDLCYEGEKYNCYNLTNKYLGYADIHERVEQIEVEIVIN